VGGGDIDPQNKRGEIKKRNQLSVKKKHKNKTPQDPTPHNKKKTGGGGGWGGGGGGGGEGGGGGGWGLFSRLGANPPEREEASKLRTTLKSESSEELTGTAQVFRT